MDASFTWDSILGKKGNILYLVKSLETFCVGKCVVGLRLFSYRKSCLQD